MSLIKYLIFVSFLFSMDFLAFGVGNEEIDAANINSALSFNKNNQEYNNFMRYNSTPEERLYISMKAGEVFNFGFQFGVEPDNGGNVTPLDGIVWVRIKNAADVVVFGPVLIDVGQPGHITSRAEADLGPAMLGLGGYNALQYTAPADGDYFLQVGYDDPAVGGPSNGLVDDPVPNGDNFMATLYDFTVVDPTTNTELTGRVWSQAWHLRIIDGWDVDTRGISQYIYTDDGVITKLNYNGMNPYQFVISANSTGVFDTGDLVEDRKSITSQTGQELFSQYKLFYEEPDTTIFKVTDIDELFGDFTSNLDITGCGEYQINVNVSKEIEAAILIERNGIPGYQRNTEDILIESLLNMGDNILPWDGRDGLGNIVRSGALTIEVVFRSGVTHLPMYDVEYNQDGFVVEYLYPDRTGSNTTFGVYWDDSNLDVNQVNLTNPCQNMGPTGCHVWGEYNPPGVNNPFGNQTIINTWWFLSQDPITVNFDLNLPFLGITPDTIVCENTSVDLIAETNGFLTWTDQNGDFVSNDTLITVMAGAPGTMQELTATARFISTNDIVSSNFENVTSGFIPTPDYAVGNVNNLQNGEYLLTDDPNNAWNTPHLTIGDHTTGTGTMLAINGSTTASQAVFRQTVNVVQNMEYGFSFWAVNTNLDLGLNPARLQMVVDGVVLGEFIISEGEWKNKFNTWVANTTGPIDIEIINLDISGTGNDFAIDDLAFGQLDDCEIVKMSTVTSISPDQNNVDIDLLPATDTFCGPERIVFTLNGTDNLGPNPTFQWMVDSMPAGGNDPRFVYFTDTNVTVKVIVTSSFATCINNPVDSAESVIIILPELGTELNSTGPFCPGELVQITTTFTNPTVDPLALTYDWTEFGSNTLNGMPTDQNQSANPIQTTTYRLTVSNAECTENVAITVSVNPLPMISILPDTTLCIGDAVSLNLEIDKDLGTTGSITWTPEPTLSITATDTVATPAFPSSTYDVTVVDADGCTNTATRTLTTAPPFTLSANNPGTICAGDSMELSVVPEPGIVPDTYVWTPDDRLTNANTANPTASPLVTTLYTVAAGLNGCFVDTQVQLNVTPRPDVNITIQGVSPVCEGDPISLEIASSNNLGATPNYEWYRVVGENRVQPPISNLETDTTSIFDNGDSIVLVVLSSLDCAIPIESNRIAPIKIFYPDLQLSGDFNVCLGNDAIITATDLNGFITDFTWLDQNLNELFTSSELVQTFTDIREDVFIQIVGSNQGCVDSSNQIKISPIEIFLNLSIEDSIIIESDNTVLSFFSEVDTVLISSSTDGEIGGFLSGGSLEVFPVGLTTYTGIVAIGSCQAFDTVMVRTLPPVSAPYLFSPNEDGKNDLWVVKDLDKYPYTRVTILNRWGAEVARLDRGKTTWDGNNKFGGKLPDGVYYYVIEASIDDFDDGGEKLIQFSGYVTLAK